MADEAWLTVGGAVIGYLIKASQDWWLATGKVKADREARAEARHDKRAERRDDLQRQTLLDLQDAAMTLARATAKGHHHDTMAGAAGGKSWGQQLWPDELSEESRAAQARLGLLRSRVRNAALRDATKEFSAACSAQGMAGSLVEAGVARSREFDAFNRVIDTAGQLVREMDDP